MKIGEKDYEIKITFSVIGRYASSKGIPLAEMVNMIQSMSYDDMVGLLVFGEKSGTLTPEHIHEAVDDNVELLGDIAAFIADQLGGGKKKAVAKKKMPVL